MRVVHPLDVETIALVGREEHQQIGRFELDRKTGHLEHMRELFSVEQSLFSVEKLNEKPSQIKFNRKHFQTFEPYRIVGFW